MARLNSSSHGPATRYRRQNVEAANVSSSYASLHAAITSSLKPKSNNKDKKSNKVPYFQIFEDDGELNSDEANDQSNKASQTDLKRSTAPLGLKHTNSITSGLSKRASQDSNSSSSRRSRSGSEADEDEEEGSDKENLFINDEAEETSDDSDLEDTEEGMGEIDDTQLQDDITDINLEALNLDGSERENAAQTTSQGVNFQHYRELSPNQESDDSEPNVTDESDGYNSLDDFIVSDNEDLSYFDDGLEEDEESKPPTPKPARRRLIRGRKPRISAVTVETHEAHTPNESCLPASPPTSTPQKTLNKQKSTVFPAPSNYQILSNSADCELPPTTFSKIKRSPLRESINSIPSSPGSTRKQQGKKMQTPPCSPSKELRPSPSKTATRIPPSPHRPSSDAFWSQELTNAWNDQWSPPKQKTRSRALERLLALDTDEISFHSTEPNDMAVFDEPSPASPSKSPSKTALKKAEVAARKEAAARKKEFHDKKIALAQDILRALDEATTGGQIDHLSQSTGGVKITWSKTLRSTAGRAKWQQERVKTGVKDAGYVQYASIELAERIIDDENRLVNTLVHEFCHLANYMISKVRDQPHGSSFKEWGAKCVKALGEHPIYKDYPVTVTTKHSYQIDYKYVWLCIDCGHKYGRHSKSIDPSKSRCSLCQGGLQQVQPKPRNVSPKKLSSPKKSFGVGNRRTNHGEGFGENFDDMLESLGNTCLV